MLRAAFLALGDLVSREFRSVLLKAIGLTLALFVVLMVVAQLGLGQLALLPWGWADTAIQVGAGLLMLAAFFFMMSPVTAMFAGLFIDGIAAKVEQKHYPQDQPGTPLSAGRAITTAVSFALIVLLVNLAVLPLVFTGIGALALIAANAYLLSREYFELAASRHMDVFDARALRKANTPSIWLAGFVPALLSIIPIVNLAVPLFATSYFVHLFKMEQRSSG
jgi:CysZ protein